MKKIKRIKYFTIALLELIAQGFIGEEVSRCDNITDTAENMIVCNKSLPTYR